MTPEEALEHKRCGGRLAEPVTLDPSVKYSGPLRIIYVPVLAQGGPGDDSGKIVIPAHHHRSER